MSPQKKPPLPKESSSVEVQTDNLQDAPGKEFFFEPLDYRKCLRCGKNDLTAKGECIFHPAMPKHPGGSGSLIYSEPWHSCHKKCKQGSPGCLTKAEHFYGVHIPYEPGAAIRQGGSVRQRSNSRDVRAVAKTEKETMTEISLMWNPFKSELNEVKQVKPREEAA